MLIRKMFAVLVLGGALVGSTASFAATASDCPLRQHHITKVAPYYTERQVGQAGVVQELIGAQVYVQAEPGLTAEWLRLSLDRDDAEMRVRRTEAMQNCPLGLEGVSVDVHSAGPGFYVKLFTQDTKKAEEVLRRARLFFGHS